ncbi:MAG TPA: PDZ domain-containing protein [Dehalococcoidia bacterium]|nr:PDZ domain-containing protein [Dehalococcoidia bacterium]
MAKRFLAESGVKYDEADVSVDTQAATEMANLTRQMGVPVIVINGEPIIGFNRTRIEQLISSPRARGNISLGLSIADANKIIQKPGSRMLRGIYIGNVRPQSYGEKAGLRVGDVITEINQTPVNNVEEMTKVMVSMQNDSRITFSFTRGDDNLTSTVEI